MLLHKLSASSSCIFQHYLTVHQLRSWRATLVYFYHKLIVEQYFNLTPLWLYLSGGLYQRGAAQTGAASGRAVLHSLQQDPGSRDVTPWDAEARLHLPAATRGHMVGYLRAETASCLVFSFPSLSLCRFIIFLSLQITSWSEVKANFAHWILLNMN